MDELWLLNVTNLRQTNQTNINDRNCLKAAITDKSRSKQAAKKRKGGRIGRIDAVCFRG